jgi:hypothetical protein
VNERDNKEFKFPAVIPIVFYSGNETWTVSTNIREMFENFEGFGSHVLNFEYSLVAVKNYTKDQLETFYSKLLSIIFMFENSRTSAELSNNIIEKINVIKNFNPEEMRIFIKILDVLDRLHGSDKKASVKVLLEDGKIEEAETMMHDIFENDRIEREKQFAEGERRNKFETAKNMILEKMPIDLILRITGLSKEQVEEIVV